MQTAFLCPDTEDGRKTSFRLTDVVSGGDISVGDEVEYVLVQMRPNAKPIAANVRKIRFLLLWVLCHANSTVYPMMFVISIS